MKSSTLIGIILGFAAIFGAYLWEGGTMNTLFMLPAMVIVFGGTIAAGLAGTSLHQISLIPRLFRLSLFPPKYDTEKIISEIVEYSTLARREGILAIEPLLHESSHPFMRKLFMVTIDGANPETLQKIVETEISFISERHQANINLFVKLGGYSPTMGIIGTVMGLISTLAAAGSDPSVLIRHIATAFIATMWGIFMANIVWLPIGDKLKTLHNEEMMVLQVILDGVYAVQLGENPSVIRARLVSAFPLSKQDEMLEKQKVIQTNYSPKHSVKAPLEEIQM